MYFKKTSESDLANKKRYYQENKEKILAKRAANKEKIAEYDKNRRINNPLAETIHHAKKKPRKLGAIPKWLNEKELFEIDCIYMAAKIMSVASGEKYEVDHVIPLKGRGVCGLHVISNLQILTMSENRKKHNRLIND